MDFAILRNVPPVTRTVVGISTILAIAVSTELVSDQALAFLPSRVAQGELWRMVSSLVFVGGFDSGFLLNWALHQSFSIWLETVYYSNSVAYAWRLVILSLFALIASAVLGIRQPIHIVLAALEYLSTRCNEGQRVLWFGMRIPAGILPFHQFFSAWLFKEPNIAKAYFVGIFLGHILLLLDDVYPRWLRSRVLAIPGESVTLD